jgi:NADH:ubiquinone oxidoreductase subunit E
MKEKIQVIICLGSSCYSRGNAKTLEVIKDYLHKNNLEDQIDFRGKLCSNNCNHGPVLFIDDKKFLDIKDSEILKLLKKELNFNKTSDASIQTN